VEQCYNTTTALCSPDACPLVQSDVASTCNAMVPLCTYDCIDQVPECSTWGDYCSDGIVDLDDPAAGEPTSAPTAAPTTGLTPAPTAATTGLTLAPTAAATGAGDLAPAPARAVAATGAQPVYKVCPRTCNACAITHGVCGAYVELASS
jgi:hypothetical protein